MVDTMTLESLASAFENSQYKYQMLIRVFQVLAQSPCDDPKYQMLKRVFQGWEPLQHPLHGLEVMSLWQRLLQGNEPHDMAFTQKQNLLLQILTLNSSLKLFFHQ